MGKLWQKKWKLNKEVETFETEGDLAMDQKIVKHDVLGSIAHAKMLKKMGVLSSFELKKLIDGLNEILVLDEKGKFILDKGTEDVHTSIENYLVERYGEVGKKIHTGRSRNDQVLTAIRLYAKEKLNNIAFELKVLTKLFRRFASKYKKIPIPGYTHMQKAMPTNIGLWAGSFADSLTDDLALLKAVNKLNDQSPLGSAAGYGSPIKTDRKFTATLLGFAKAQKNSIYCQNSRLKIEAAIIASLISILMTINKFASDLMLFTTYEFNFFEVDRSICTGSSIMPQKKNLDLAELLRSKLHLVIGNYISVVSLSSNLITGYNRDYQDTKKPFFDSLKITSDCLKACGILLTNIKPNKQVLKKAMTTDLYATQTVYDLVKRGIAFREAYKKVAEKLR